MFTVSHWILTDRVEVYLLRLIGWSWAVIGVFAGDSCVPQALLGVLTPLGAAEIFLGISHDFSTLGAFSLGVVFPEFKTRAAVGTGCFKDVIGFPETLILAWAALHETSFQSKYQQLFDTIIVTFGPCQCNPISSDTCLDDHQMESSLTCFRARVVIPVKAG